MRRGIAFSLAIMIALVIRNMFCRLWGVLAIDAEIFLRGSQPVSALVIVLFYFCCCSLDSGMRRDTFFLRPSPERSLLTTLFMFDGRPRRDSTGWVAVVRKRRCFGFCWISSLFSWPASCLCLWLFGGNVSFIFPENLELEALDPEALGLQATCMKYYSSQTVFILCSSHLAEPQFRYRMEVLGPVFWTDWRCVLISSFMPIRNIAWMVKSVICTNE